MNFPLITFAVDMLVSSHASADPAWIQVSNPAELAAMGFPATAVNVWRLPNDSTDPGLPDRAPLGSTPTNASYAMTGEDFVTISSLSDYNSAAYGHLYCPTGATSRIASASVNVPTDRRLFFLDMWGRDASATQDMSATLYATCQPADGAGTPNNFVLAEVTSPAIVGDGDFFEFDTVSETYFDPQRCGYSVNLVLGSGTCVGSDLTLYKVRVVIGGNL